MRVKVMEPLKPAPKEEVEELKCLDCGAEVTEKDCVGADWYGGTLFYVCPNPDCLSGRNVRRRVRRRRR